jgi:transposase
LRNPERSGARETPVGTRKSRPEIGGSNRGKKFVTLFLDGCIKQAEASGIKVPPQMAKALAAYRSGLLAYYDARITSGLMAGTNNKIKTMRRQAYGFRDNKFFRLKILAIHETRYELVR